jgi:DNA-directed RNA polymerase specialized sigma24 family protein
MTRGTIKTREYYLACRRDNTIMRSLQLTAEYKGMSKEEVADILGIDLQEIKPDVYCAFKGCGTRLPADYAQRYAHCPKHIGDLLDENK